MIYVTMLSVDQTEHGVEERGDQWVLNWEFCSKYWPLPRFRQYPYIGREEGRKEGRNSNQGDKRCSDRCMSQALNKYKANVTV